MLSIARPRGPPSRDLGEAQAGTSGTYRSMPTSAGSPRCSRRTASPRAPRAIPAPWRCSSMRIFHIAVAAEWEGGPRGRRLPTSTPGRTLAEEGFILLSRGPVAAGPPRLLRRDGPAGPARHRHRPAHRAGPRGRRLPGSDRPFPHVYGPINPDAVVETRDLSLPGGGHISRLSPVPIWRPSTTYRPTWAAPVVIGNFDSVHLGHQHVVARAREVADTER